MIKKYEQQPGARGKGKDEAEGELVVCTPHEPCLVRAPSDKIEL